MEQLEFEAWWNAFQSTHKDDDDSGFEAMQHLKSAVEGFSADKRVGFINELIAHNHIGDACDLIPLYGNDNQKRIIRDRLNQWIDSNSQEPTGQIFITAILATYTENDKAIITKYFDEQRTVWFHVPTELYQIDRELFLKSFEKYLLRYDDNSLYMYEGLLYLVKHLDILKFLIERLSPQQSERLKKFCALKSKKTFLDSETINSLLILSKD